MAEKYTFLHSNGEHGELIRTTDWSATILGDPDTWPESLRSAVSIVLGSGFPIAIYWGPAFSLIYNEPWSAIPGEKHPWALGQPGEVVWPEIWTGLREEFESVLHEGASYRRPDAPLYMHRHGYTEECYFDYTLSPIKAVDGSIGGVFNAVIETTFRVINDRRNKLLTALMNNKNVSRNLNEAVTLVTDILKSSQADIPFFAIYGQRNNEDLHVLSTEGLSPVNEPVVFRVDIEHIATQLKGLVPDVTASFPEPITNFWPEPVEEAFAAPLAKDEAELKGYLLCGISARKRLDEDYRHFLESVALHAGTILNNALAYELGEAYNNILALNEELSSANEELAAVNEELQLTQDHLNKLNDQLEERIQQRTREVIGERDKMQRFLMQAPAGICILSGRELVFELVNQPYQELLPQRELLGRPIFEAVPEIEGQPIGDILRNVYSSGEPYEGREVLIPLTSPGSTELVDRYFNFYYQPTQDANGNVEGIIAFVYEVTELVESRKHTEKVEADLRELVMTSHYPLIILRGPEYVIEVANKQLATLWHKSLKEIIGRKLLDILPELVDQPFPALLKKVYDTGEPYGQEEEMFFVDTEEGRLIKYVSFYYDPIRDSKGVINGIIVTASDITEMVRSRQLLEDSNAEQQSLNEEIAATNEELATTNEELSETQQLLERTIGGLQESEGRFRNLIRNASTGIILLTGPEMRTEIVNEAYANLIGRSTDEITGRPLFELIPETEEVFRPIIDGVRLSGKARYLYDQPFSLFKNGELINIFLNVIYQPYREQDKGVTGVMVLCQEVTEQVKAKQHIQASEQRFRFMLNAIPQQVWTATPDGALNYVNDIICTDFGEESSETITGLGWQAYVHPDDLPGALEKWTRSLHNGREYLTEFRLKFADGEYYWHLARALPLVENDQIVMWLGTNTNIHQQKTNEYKKDEFISIASHELKTPLTTVKAFFQLAKREISQLPKLEPFIAKADRQLERLGRLIEDLLDVSRINAGKMTYNKENFDFRQMLLDVVESIQQTSIQHHIDVQMNCDVTYRGDQHRIEQVMTNLLNNAIKYSPGADKIIVHCEKENQNLIVSVQDFGIGIAEEHLKGLFDRFYRVDNSSARFQGLGLGLFIAAEIVKRHGGSFWIESQPDQGSTFFFLLPLSGVQEFKDIATDNRTFYEGDFITIHYQPEGHYMDVDWKGYQNYDSVTKGCEIMLDLMQKNNCQLVLNDNTSVKGNWSEASDWGAEVWFPAMAKAGLKKFAWIYSPSTFSRIAAGKSLPDEYDIVQVAFFDEKNAAEQWLLR